VGRFLILFLALHATTCGKELRIGVFGLFHPSELVLRASPGGALSVHLAGDEWRLEGPQTAHFRVSRTGILCTIGDRVVTTSEVRVSGTGSRTEFFLSVPGKIDRRFVATLDILLRGGELVPILITDLETAVESVVAAESNQGAPLEALKAQAIAARSFYVASSARHQDFHFCDTTHCQFLRQPPEEGDVAGAAASATKSLILLHMGAPLAALFSASCGGRTRTLSEAGMIVSDGYPYYAVECLPCLKRTSHWKRSFPIQYDRLLEDQAEAHRIELNRLLGWNALPGYNYEVSREGDHIVVHGRGQGHGIGLCQRGAIAMAGSGADYRLVLNHYYPNTVIGVVNH